jgi:hypothetical protein
MKTIATREFYEKEIITLLSITLPLIVFWPDKNDRFFLL